MFLNMISDLLRSVYSWGAVGLVLALVFVFEPQELTAQQKAAQQIPFTRPPVSPPPCPKGPPVSIVVDLSTGTHGNPPLDIASGLVDPKWFLVSSPGLLSSAAIVTNTGWPILNTTQPANWIQRKKSVTAQKDASGAYTYRTGFKLKTSQYSKIQLAFRYGADNSAGVKLNNNLIASCGGPSCFLLGSPSWVNVVTLSTPGTVFLNGVNNLDVVVTNNNLTLTGLIVDARLVLSCQ
jgi:hypothetical protein